MYTIPYSQSLNYNHPIQNPPTLVKRVMLPQPEIRLIEKKNDAELKPT